MSLFPNSYNNLPENGWPTGKRETFLAGPIDFKIVELEAFKVTFDNSIKFPIKNYSELTAKSK